MREVAVEKSSGFLFIPGHEVPVAVERNRDRGVPKVAGQGLGVDARRGRVDYCGSSRRYVLNGGLDAATKAALRELEL